jgi:phage terminase large subunit-like protein
MTSEAARVARLTQEDRLAWFKGKGDVTCERLLADWRFWRRPDQVAPIGDWRIWLVMAGRGFGKTRAGAEWVRAQAEADGRLRIALVGASIGEVRQIMVEGESGLLSIAPPHALPEFAPSLKRLTWPNGAVATLYSAAEPDSLRGPEHHLAWCDEVAKWPYAEAVWNNLMMTLRLGNTPQITATTTPRPVPLIKRLLSEKGVIVTRGKMRDNRLNVARDWMNAMEGLYSGTRLGRQELDGELVTDIEHALWSRALLEACRVTDAPTLTRVVIGVDPPASAGGDACGIIAVGLGADGKAYVLGDHSVSGRSPEGWARAVAGAAEAWGADRVIAEANNGGDMVVSTLRAADVSMPVKKVHASRGKCARAEPIAALYEAGKARHVGAFPALEDELCGLVSGGLYQGPGRSPDRADACVWAMTEVMLGKGRITPRVRGF